MLITAPGVVSSTEVQGDTGDHGSSSSCPPLPVLSGQVMDNGQPADIHNRQWVLQEPFSVARAWPEGLAILSPKMVEPETRAVQVRRGLLLEGK